VNRDFRQQQNAINVVEDVASPRELLPVAASLTENQIKQWSPQALSFLGDSVWEVGLLLRIRRLNPFALVGHSLKIVQNCVSLSIQNCFQLCVIKYRCKWGGHVLQLFVRTAYFMPREHVKAYNANVKRGVIAEAQVS
jgi:23S rRNA maturation mini-RNase III